MSRGTELLRQLILFRHDPELAVALREEAMKGDLDAQYGLGLVYAEGRGVAQDEVEAYAWLSVAMLDGDPEAEALRDLVTEHLRPEQVRDAVDRAGTYVVQIGGKRTRH
jgi:TPR repeat protein